MKGRKQSIAGTIRLFYRRLNTIEELKNEIEAQVSNNTEIEIVSLTHEEFKRLMGEIENIVDELTESDNQDAEGPLAEADQLIRLKMEVAQKVKRHEMLRRTLTSRPNSAASTQSNRTTASTVVETNARNSRELTNSDTTGIHISEPIDDEPSNTESYLAESSETSTDQISITAPNQQENSEPVFSSRLHEQNVTPNMVLQSPASQQTVMTSTIVNQDATLQRSLESGNYFFSENTTNIHNLPTSITSFVHGPDTVQTTMLHPQQASVACSSRPYYNPTPWSILSSCNQWPTAFASSAISNQYVQAPVNYELPVSVSQQNHPVFANQLPTTLSWNSNTDQGQFNYRFRNPHRSVKLPDIRIQKYDGDPLKWNEWSSMFTSTIHNNPDITNTERMSYLQSFVIGPAKECISGFLCNPNFYKDALNELNRRFGNPQNVVSALTQELEAWQRPQANDHRALISYAALLRKIVQTFLDHGFNADLSATYLLKLARDKLPNSLKMKWSEHTIDNNIQNPGILEFSEWMDRHSRACEQLQETSPQNSNNNGFQGNIRRNNSTVSNSSQRNQFSANVYSNSNNQQRPNDRRNNQKSFQTSNNFSRKQNINNQQPGFSGNQNLNAGKNTSIVTKNVKTKCPLDQQEHYIGRCQQFNKFDVARRNLEVKKHSLCFNCLSPSHSAKECASKVVCRHCNGKHHSLLHDPDKQKKRTETTNLTDVELPLCEPLNRKMNSTVDTPTYNPGFPAKSRNQLQAIPVTLFGENKEKVECYAILDNGSTISYVLDTTANGINAPKAIQFDLNVMHAFDQSVINANLVRLDIGRYNDDEPLFRLNSVHSINNWKFSDAPVQELNETCATYSHLQHIKFPNLGNNKIQLLLGVDATQFILEREFLQGPTGTPFAIKNLLGWTITGPMKRKAEESYHAETNLLSHSYRPFDKALTCSTFHDEKPLCDYVTSFWKIDNAGTEPEEPKNFSKDSESALDFFEKTIRHNGTRYEIGLLWKNNVQLQNNYPVAKAQLSSLQRRLSKDHQLSVLYDATLQTDIEKGYVKPVVFENPQPERIWYLPHHPVSNPNKPGKVRQTRKRKSSQCRLNFQRPIAKHKFIVWARSDKQFDWYLTSFSRKTNSRNG